MSLYRGLFYAERLPSALYFILIVCLGATLSSATAYGQEDRQALLHYRNLTQKVLENAEKLVRPVLSPEERTIQSQVSVRVPVSGESGAYARRSLSGRPEILISSGMTRTLEWLATAEIFEVYFGFRGCHEEYGSYLIRGIAENSARITRNESLRPVFAPYLYGRRIGGACKGLPQDFGRNIEAGQHFAGLMDASLVFLYLHELAHHILMHIGNTPTFHISRKQENEADAWAITTAYKANFDLIAASPAFNLIAGLGGGSLEDEIKQTHPLGIKRVFSMLTEARDIMVQKQYPHIAELDRAIAEIQRKLPSKR